MKIENWCGYDIRFVEKDGEWWAILKDICDALHLQVGKVSQRLDSSMMERVPVEVEVPSKHVDSQTFWMVAVNEIGIYEALFASRRLEARKFRMWTADILRKLRKKVGLEGYQVMRMTDKDVQDEIDHILDTLFWDEETGMLMQSITVPGGDVEQVPFEPRDRVIYELINRRRRQILVHSVIYYKMNDNLIADSTWSKWAVELADLQEKYPEIAKRAPYAEAFEDFDPSSGYNLPLDDPWAINKAHQLLAYRDRHI